MRAPQVALAALAVSGLTASLLAGCSSSKGASSTTAASSSTTAAVQGSTSAGVSTASTGISTARSALTSYENPNPVIEVPALPSTPPKGKTVDFLTCPVSICTEIEQGVQAAAAQLGWTVKVVDGGLTPASYVSAMDGIVQNPGDAVLGIGFLPNSAIQTELSTLASKHIPFIAAASPSAPGPDMLANFESGTGLSVTGTVMADWIIADSNGNAHIAFFWDPSLNALLGTKNDFLSEMTKLCPGCSVSIQTADFLAGIGTKIPGQIVSYLQANPATNYLVVSDADAMVGVGQALNAAGLSGKVKIVTRAAGPLNFKDIAAGTETMAVTDESSETGWRMIDAAARSFLGVPLTDPSPTGTIHIITKSNLPSNLNAPYTVPNYQSYFLKAWHLQ